ncbi:hypothetical protein [Olleya sp. R77988]|uniref:hypothetical protein n=1 Tax=Olleya sp. R77988 TaxID=3093875 RepID=UPI0037CB24E6
MDILQLQSKTHYKLISICLAIAAVTGTIYYFTRGGFFDGILLTFVGLALTYFILILALLLFKTLTNILAKKTIRVSDVVIAFIVTATICTFLFVMLFKLIANEF